MQENFDSLFPYFSDNVRHWVGFSWTERCVDIHGYIPIHCCLHFRNNLFH